MKKGLCVWFFETASGSLVSSFAKSLTVARINVASILRIGVSELTLVSTPIETGRYIIEVQKQG